MSNYDAFGSLGLPIPIAAFVEAVNTGNADALIATFADDALVNDQQREYWHKLAISEWVGRDVIPQHFAMQVTKAIVNHDQVVVRARVTGDFDVRGLPNPLLLAFYFSLRADHIVQLLILRNESDD